jgi:hypothetical protein
MESSCQQMVTASWDATVKIWTMDEGRGSWATTLGSSKSTRNASKYMKADYDGSFYSIWKYGH